MLKMVPQLHVNETTTEHESAVWYLKVAPVLFIGWAYWYGLMVDVIDQSEISFP